MTTAKSIIKLALRELGLYASGEEPQPEEYTDALEALNDILESWQADERAFYSEIDATFALTIGTGQYAVGNSSIVVTSITRSGTTATVTCRTKHSFETGNKATISGCTQTDYNVTAAVTVLTPYIFTIQVANSPATPASTATAIAAGNGDFNTVDRPVDLLGAFVRASGADSQLAIVTERYWDMIASKADTAALPVRVLYRPNVPFGQLLLHKVPSGAGTLHAKLRNTLVAFAAIETDQTMPLGYKRALGLAVAISMAPQFGAAVTQETMLSITSAFKAIWELNTGKADAPQPSKTVIINQAPPQVSQ